MNQDLQQATFHFAETPEEREAIYRLRYKIYVEEMHIFKDDADHEQKILFGEDDATARLLYAKLDGEIIGALRLNLGCDAPFSEQLDTRYNLSLFRDTIKDGRMMVLTRFIIAEPYRNTTLGFNMIGQVAETCIREKIEVAVCDCQPHLVSYYQRIGFKSYDCPVYGDPEFGILIPLVLVVGDTNYLKSINSPLLRAFSRQTTNTNLVDVINGLLGRPAVEYATNLYEDRQDDLATMLHSGKVALFDGLQTEDIRRLIVLSHVFDCQPDHQVIRKGQPVTTMYILLSGSLEIRDGDEVVYQSAPGEVIGEMAMLLVTRRTADVYAGKDGARLLSLNEKVMQMSINTPSVTSSKLLLNLSKMIASKLAASMGQDLAPPSQPISNMRFV